MKHALIEVVSGLQLRAFALDGSPHIPFGFVLLRNKRSRRRSRALS